MSLLNFFLPGWTAPEIWMPSADATAEPVSDSTDWHAETAESEERYANYCDKKYESQSNSAQY